MTLTFSPADQAAREKMHEDADRIRRTITFSQDQEALRAWLSDKFPAVGSETNKLVLYGIARELYEEARTVYRSTSKASSVDKLISIARLGSVPCTTADDLQRIEDAVLIMARHYSQCIDGVTALGGAHVERARGVSTLVITVRFDT